MLKQVQHDEIYLDTVRELFATAVAGAYKKHMIGRTITLCLLTLALSGCSSTYDLRAIMLDGKLAFTPDDTDIWGNPDPDCLRSIEVTIVDGPPATTEEGDDIRAVERGTYWAATFKSISCENPFPVHYGSNLKGESFFEEGVSDVSAKPLVFGYSYTISASSSGSAYGDGKFRITENGAVENLPRWAD